MYGQLVDEIHKYIHTYSFQLKREELALTAEALSPDKGGAK
jgi:hypothetical protein